MFLEKKEVNTGRQVEFDYLKGLFIPMILLVHAFQMLGGTSEPVFHVIYTICTLTGSTIFLFVMGLGSTYSKRTERQMAVSGLKLILWQLVWNVLALALPFLLGQGIRAVFGLSMDRWPLALGQITVLLEYINIFFIAGISYLLLALMKKLRVGDWGYLILAVIFLVVTPFVYMTGKSTGIPVLDYILTMFLGGRAGVSLCFMPHFTYVLFGVWFGRILRRVSDKSALYLRILPGALVIGVGYLVYVIVTNSSLAAVYSFVGYQYVYSGIFRMLSNLSWTLLAAAAFYALQNKIKSIRVLDKVLMHLNRKTSQYYAIHPFLYSLLFSVAAMAPYGWAACIGIAVVDIFLCYIAVRIWDKFCRYRSGRIKK